MATERRGSRYLLNYRRNYYSQSGEDGVLEYIVAKLPAPDRWCVEFGAWDGIHLSNTHNLVARHGYSAVFIEADSERFETLVSNMKKFSRVTCRCALVETDGPNSLDRILAQTEVPAEFDVPSVDIDGEDYHVWASLRDYRPKVVIIEINNWNKPGIVNVQAHGKPCRWGVDGTSISSMTELAHQKGYSLLAHVGCNVIFMRNHLLSIFHSVEPTPSQVFTYEGLAYSKLSTRERVRKFMERLRALMTRVYQPR